MRRRVHMKRCCPKLVEPLYLELIPVSGILTRTRSVEVGKRKWKRADYTLREMVLFGGQTKKSRGHQGEKHGQTIPYKYAAPPAHRRIASHELDTEFQTNTGKQSVLCDVLQELHKRGVSFWKS